MTDSTEMDFSKLTLSEKIETVDERTGNQPDRIKHPYELLDLRGERLHIVLSPFGKENNIGTCFMIDWVVGDVKDHRGNEISKDIELSFDDDQKYICFHAEDNENGISLKDFNIIPNSYNNHLVFTTKEGAEAYSMYRKMIFKEDDSISELEGDYNPFFTTVDIERFNKAEEADAENKDDSENKE